MSRKVTLNKYSIARTPSIPNFIDINGVFISISKIHQADLNKIARVWTKLLVARGTPNQTKEGEK